MYVFCVCWRKHENKRSLLIILSIRFSVQRLRIVRLLIIFSFNTFDTVCKSCFPAHNKYFRFEFLFGKDKKIEAKKKINWNFHAYVNRYLAVATFPVCKKVEIQRLDWWSRVYGFMSHKISKNTFKKIVQNFLQKCVLTAIMPLKNDRKIRTMYLNLNRISYLSFKRQPKLKPWLILIMLLSTIVLTL